MSARHGSVTPANHAAVAARADAATTVNQTPRNVAQRPVPDGRRRSTSCVPAATIAPASAAVSSVLPDTGAPPATDAVGWGSSARTTAPGTGSDAPDSQSPRRPVTTQRTAVSVPATTTAGTVLDDGILRG